MAESPSRRLCYSVVRDCVVAKHPRHVLYRIVDSERQEQWILRLELRGGLIVGQRYVEVEGEEDLLSKTAEYNSMALEMLFRQLLETEDSPYRITGISLE